jgi:hypothetical protein
MPMQEECRVRGSENGRVATQALSHSSVATLISVLQPSSNLWANKYRHNDHDGDDCPKSAVEVANKYVQHGAHLARLGQPLRLTLSHSLRFRRQLCRAPRRSARAEMCLVSRSTEGFTAHSSQQQQWAQQPHRGGRGSSRIDGRGGRVRRSVETARIPCGDRARRAGERRGPFVSSRPNFSAIRGKHP